MLTLCPSDDLLWRWPPFLSRRVSNRLGMLAFMLAEGSDCEGIDRIAASCANGSSAGSGGGRRIERRGVDEESEGVGADQKPNGSRLSCKEQLGHPPGCSGVMSRNRVWSGVRVDQAARIWIASRRERVGKYVGASVGAISVGGSRFQVTVVDRPSPKVWRVVWRKCYQTDCTGKGGISAGARCCYVRRPTREAWAELAVVYTEYAVHYTSRRAPGGLQSGQWVWC